MLIYGLTRNLMGYLKVNENFVQTMYTHMHRHTRTLNIHMPIKHCITENIATISLLVLIVHGNRHINT